MEARVNELLAKFPDGKVCCYTCAYNFFGGLPDIIKALVYVNYPVETLVAQTQPSELFIAFYTMGLRNEPIVKRTARILINCYGPRVAAPLIHRRYRQRDQLDVYSKIGNEQVTMMGSVRMGQVLEIYNNDHSNEIAGNVISNLKSDFLTLIDHPDHYDDLRGLRHDKYMVFDNLTGQIEVGKIRREAPTTRVYNHDNWTGITERDRGQHWVDVMKKTKRVSLIIVKHLRGCTPDYKTDVGRFLEIIKNIIAPLDFFIVVFEISYNDFNSVKMKKTARVRSNTEVDAEDKSRVVWLDTSAVTKRIGLPEDNKTKNLTVRNFTDGCV